MRRCRLNILPDRSIAAQRSLLASRSLSRRARMSFLLTGPLTFLTKVLFTLPMKATLTCVIPPLEPVSQKQTRQRQKPIKRRKNAKRIARECSASRVQNGRKTASQYEHRQASSNFECSGVGGRQRHDILTGFADDFLDDSVHDFTRVHVRI